MSMRDELASALGGRARKVITDPTRLTPLFEWALADAAVPVIERALAAERAAFASVHVPVLVSDDAGTHMECEGCAWNSKVAAWEEHANAKDDRSALDEMLARARAEQLEGILQVLSRHRIRASDLVGWYGECSCQEPDQMPVDFETKEDYCQHLRERLAAIRGQK